MRYLPLLLLIVATGCAPTFAPGDEIRGALTEDDQTTADGYVVDDHRLHLPAGPSVLLTVTAEAYDPFIVLASGDKRLGQSTGEAGQRAACVTVDPVEGEALDLFVSSGIEDGLAYGPYVLSTEPATAERIDALLCLPTSREAPPGG